MERLSGKIALVTGSSRGIGKAIVLELARNGAAIAINFATNSDAAHGVAREIEALGGSRLLIKGDVSKSEDVEEIFEKTLSRFGKLDILVNNAGRILYKTIVDTTLEEFDKISATNTRGTFLTCKKAAAVLSERGTIVNVSSSVTRLMLPTYGVYSVSKAAVEQLTRVLARELGPKQIRVNAILPGPTETELFRQGKTVEQVQKLGALAALGRIGTPKDVAGIVTYLASDESGWITGQCIGVNGGFA